MFGDRSKHSIKENVTICLSCGQVRGKWHRNQKANQMQRDSFQELSKVFIHSQPQSGTVDSITYYGPEPPTSQGVAAGENQVGFNGMRLLLEIHDCRLRV